MLGGLEDRAVWRYLEAGNTTAVQHDESIAVPCAKNPRVFRQRGDDVLYDIVGAVSVGCVVHDIDLPTAG